MKLGIHQPQFLPWINYFLKIEECDYFVLLDSVDYQKNGLQNRNQIKTINGKSWLTVPVENKLGCKISDIKILNTNNWKKKHLGTIHQFYSKASQFNNYYPELKKIYDKDWTLLSNFNFELIKMMMSWLNIRTPLVLSSQLNLTGKSNELIINICNKLNADTYISGDGAKNYLDQNLFEKSNINLTFNSKYTIKQYNQLYREQGFMNDLSAIDIIFNCGDSWKKYLI